MMGRFTQRTAAAYLVLGLLFVSSCGKAEVRCWWSGKCSEEKKVEAEAQGMTAADGSPVIASYLNVEGGDYGIMKVLVQDPNKNKIGTAAGSIEYVQYDTMEVTYSELWGPFSRSVQESVAADGAVHPVSVEVIRAQDKAALYWSLLSETSGTNPDGTARLEADRVDELHKKYGGVYRDVKATVVLRGKDTNGNDQEARGTILASLTFKRDTLR